MRKMEHPRSIQGNTESLVDYISTCAAQYGQGVLEQLEYLDRFLHTDTALFRKMTDHAQSLRERCTQTNGHQINIKNIVAKLTDEEHLLVNDYMHALSSYLTGSQFEPVQDIATKLLNLKPIPDSAKIPDTPFYRKLALARAIV